MVSTGCALSPHVLPTYSPIYHPDTERAQTTNPACRCHPKGAQGATHLSLAQRGGAASSVLRQA